jgi:hypothetical protein
MASPTSPGGRTRRPLYLLLGGIAAVVILAMVVIPVFSRDREAARMTAEMAAGGAIGFEGAGRGGGGFAGVPRAMPASREAGFETVAASSWPTKPMLIRTASMRLRVEDVPAAQAEVERISREAGGYVAASSITTEAGPTHAAITVRVPSEGLESVIDQIAALGRLLSKEMGAQEVTEEYVDLTSRRRNLEREEVRLLELLQRAGKVTDLLEVEQTLARVRGEIETISGRMRYLEDRVALSTVQVQLEGPQPKPTAGAPAWAAGDVARQAMRSLIGTGRGLATMAIWIALYTPVWLPALLVILWLVRRSVRQTT